MRPDQETLARTTHAALLLYALGGEFPDEKAQREVAVAADVAQPAVTLRDLPTGTVHLGLEALEYVYRTGVHRTVEVDPEFREVVSVPRVLEAHMELALELDERNGEQYDLLTTCLAAVVLDAWVRNLTPVMTPELRRDAAERKTLRDTLERLSLTEASVTDLTPDDRYAVRQSVVEGQRLLRERQDLIDRVPMIPDLHDALTAERLDAAYAALHGGVDGSAVAVA